MKNNLTQFICKSSVIAVFALTAASAHSQNFLVAEGTTAQLYSSGGILLGTFASGFGTIIGVAEGGGNIFISDYLGGVTKYSSSGTSLGVVDTGNAGTYGPTGLAFTGGRIQTAGFNNGFVMSSAPDAGAEDGNPATPSSYLFYNGAGNSPHGMTSGAPNGFTGVYHTTVNQADNNSFLNYWEPGVSAIDNIITFGIGTNARGVVADGSGNLFIALNQTGTIVRRDSVGNVTNWKVGLTSPVGLAIDGGNLFVSSFAGGITAYDLGTGAAGASFATAAGTQYFIVTAIPEPSTVGLLVIGGLGALVAIRRRRTQQA